MASMEIEGDGGGAVREVEGERSNEVETRIRNRGNTDNSKKSKKKKRKYSFYLPKFACLRTEQDGKGNFDMEVDFGGERRKNPTHLVVMVNGIIGSAQNWRYAAKQFLKRYPEDVVVHCSECNSSILTFDGVDVMGGRLAEEVISVIKRHPSVQKISFIGHSLGGLIARYAIAKLYGRNPSREVSQGDVDSKTNGSGKPCMEETFEGKIAGLEPMNFITSATPHLGSRWHRQVPVFCGFHTLEKVAARNSWLLGRTGKHLFLTDSDSGEPPLLLRMVSDCGDLKFLSALQSFRRHVVYANVRFDHLVGWSTSSLRSHNELPKRRLLSRDSKYPHIVNVETAKTCSPQNEVSEENKTNGHKNMDLEEEMIRGLTKVSWERVDVSFSGIKQRFLAHTTIQVKSLCMNSDGADVVQHMIDTFLL